MRDAFFSVALPELPDGGAASVADTAAAERRPHHLSDRAMTCPDGLVEEVLWGLLHGLTAPVIADGPGRGTVRGGRRG